MELTIYLNALFIFEGKMHTRASQDFSFVFLNIILFYLIFFKYYYIII